MHQLSPFASRFKRDFRNASDWNIYAQRIDGTGASLWTANGVPICTEKFDQVLAIDGVVSDGSGGAIILWHDERNGNTDLYAQRISAA